MKYLILLPLLYISIEASMPPIKENQCGKLDNGTAIELGQLCDPKRRCTNAMNGFAVCRCDWVGKWTPIDGLDNTNCVCEKDQKGVQLIEVNDTCICPNNQQNVPFDGCVTPATSCGPNEVLACYDLTGCWEKGDVKYEGHREDCDSPCVAKCVLKSLVQAFTPSTTVPPSRK